MILNLKILHLYLKLSMEGHNWQAISCLKEPINKQDYLNSCSSLAEVSYQLSPNNISPSIQELLGNTLRIF